MIKNTHLSELLVEHEGAIAQIEWNASSASVLIDYKSNKISLMASRYRIIRTRTWWCYQQY